MNIRYKMLAGAAMLVGVIGYHPAANAGLSPAGKGFIVNQGQWPSDVLALARTSGMDVWIKGDGMLFDQHGVVDGKLQGVRTQATWVNAKADQRIVTYPSENLPPVYIFNGRNKGQSAATQTLLVDRLMVRNLYDGVTISYMIEDERVRFDIMASTAKQTESVKLHVEGANAEKVVADGSTSFSIKGADGTAVIDLRNLNVYQNSTRIPARFAVSATSTGAEVAFVAATADPNEPILIDPLVYGTYVGGVDDDTVVAVRRMLTGENAVLLKSTNIEFPDAVGAYKGGQPSGAQDALIVVYDSTLTKALRYAYVGGSNGDNAVGLVPDQQGNLVVAGNTLSADFPITQGAASQVYRVQTDAFVFKITGDLTTLKASTYIGGNKDDFAYAVTVDGEGNMYVCGVTNSTTQFPLNAAYQKTLGGNYDAFLTKVNSSGASFAFSTYFGKEDVDVFTAIAIDGTSTPVVVGYTQSSNFQTFPLPKTGPPGPGGSKDERPYDRTYNGLADAVVVKFGSDGGTLVYSTFFGGKLNDYGRGIAVDAQSRVYITGETFSTDVTTVITNGHKPTKTGAATTRDAFLGVLSPDGRELDAFSYYGGAGDEFVSAIVLDQSSGVAIVGQTASNDLSTAGAGARITRSGTNDGFVAVLNTTATTLKYGTYLGGTGNDYVKCVDLLPESDLLIGGITTSANIGLPSNGFDLTPGGKVDGFVAKLAKGTVDLAFPSGGESICTGSSQNITWNAFDMSSADRYIVEYTVDGTLWKQLAKDVSSTSYNWKPDTSLVAGSAYKIRVRSGRGHSSASQPFTLNRSPAIATQPADYTTCIGQPITISVAASGSELKYKWKKDGNVLPDFTGAVLEIPSASASHAGKYTVEVSGKCSPSVTSRSVTVALGSGPSISQQPQALSVQENKPFTLSVTAAGPNLTYKWKKDGSDIPSATSHDYKVMSAKSSDAGDYTCVVTSPCGDVTTESAKVEVTPATSVDEDLARGLHILSSNPATDEIRFQLSEPTDGTVRVQLVDLAGVTVYATQFIHTEGDVLRVPVAQMVSGSYILNIQYASFHRAAMVHIVH